MEQINIAKLIEENKAEISRKLLDNFSDQVAKSLGWSLRDAVQTFAEKYIAENVLPDVQKLLEAERGMIAMTIAAHVKTGLDLLGETLLKRITDNVNSSWNVAEIAKKLLA